MAASLFVHDPSDNIAPCDVPRQAYWPLWKDAGQNNEETETGGGELRAFNRYSNFSATTQSSYDTQAIQSSVFLPAGHEDGEELTELSIPKNARWNTYRWIRWKLFSSYRCLFMLIFLANLGVLLGIVSRKDFVDNSSFSANTMTAASVNLAVAVLIRNEHVVNLLFLLSTSIPTKAPLFLRRWFAKIYTYGGIHSGCAVAAVIWYVGFAGSITYHVRNPPFASPATVTIVYITLLMLLLISLSAIPWMRTHLHDCFESIHRFAGWAAIAMFWIQIIIAAQGPNTSSTSVLIQNPTFWCLISITLCVIYPWARLRRRECLAERLSSHAVRLYFLHQSVHHCSAVRLATNPLKETHAFAAIPNTDKTATGYSVIISRAGNWTSKIIDNPPQQLFVRGGPFFGVLRVAVMFKPVLIVATGSGIGPCLSLFHGVPTLDCCILWSASNPARTYGEEVINDVLAADPGATILDTGKTGRPDLVRLTYCLWRLKNCEAVVIISNSTVTTKVVYEMEIRGVPVYGPVFDS